MFNPRPQITAIPIGPDRVALQIDDALTEPDRWVELAAKHRAEFLPSPLNAYPGSEMRMPDELSARVDQFFAQHVRARLGARRTVRMYTRLAVASHPVEQLQPRQWFCHRDRLDPAPDRCVLASVLYLFRDPALGGTGFYRPLRPHNETARLIHDSGQLDAASFAARYGIERGYQTRSNAWFEKTATLAPRYNRLVFYDGGEVFHSGDIERPDLLDPDPARGRLTLNGFYICRRSLA